MPDDTADRSALKAMLARNSVRFGNFTLVSGEKSDVYVDCKLTTYTPDAMPLIGRLILRKFAERGWRPEAVGGLTLGADPIAFAIARESLTEANPVRAFVIRKEPKKHGMERFIEGMDHTEGLPVVVIDDVCTKGGSTLQAIEKAKQAGMRVIGAVCLVDREMGARELLEGQHGCPFDSIFKLSDLRADRHA
jgi:orotate phosphoribosyltransferase